MALFYFVVALIGIPGSLIGVWQLAGPARRAWLRFREARILRAAPGAMMVPGSEPSAASMAQNSSPLRTVYFDDRDKSVYGNAIVVL
jgi:hypothetical protein